MTTPTPIAPTTTTAPATLATDIVYVDYTDESMLADIQALVSKDLSEPYSIFTYRYFLHNWPELCICAYTAGRGGGSSGREMIGTIICKMDVEGDAYMKGYVAMLAVSTSHRKRGIGLTLAHMGIDRMVAMGCDEVGLEAESTNGGALGLYEKLGFVRDDKLGRYYLNGGDAFRLRLWIDPELRQQEDQEDDKEGDQPEQQVQEKETSGETDKRAPQHIAVGATTTVVTLT